MSSLLVTLQTQLACFDEDAFVALANRGLYRRAQKDLEKLPAEVIEDTPQQLTVALGEYRIRFDPQGPARAQCSCPASGVCQHILAAAISLQRLAPSGETAASANTSAEPDPQLAVAGPAPDPLEALSAALLAIAHADLVRHAGRPGYRWAWQYVEDLDPECDLTVAGERHIVIGLRHPRITLRYMGGGLASLVADVDTPQLARLQVAAVLAYRRAMGLENPPPSGTAQQSGQLDLGKDHVIAASLPEAQAASRARLCAALTALLGDCIELGLSHLSPAVHERFTTLAMWAQGAEYYRMALLLRRIADHVEALLARTGDADEHRLFDELTLAHGLTSALLAAAAQGRAPAALVGRARSQYVQSGAIELLGLGAMAWRAKSGYVGLTTLFWAPQEQVFMSYTDARPELQRAYNPVARYDAPGPWSGLGALSLTTGRRVRLTHAQINPQGRISGVESTSAAVQSVADFAQGLAVSADWADLARQLAGSRRSLLAEPEPMRDWAVLAPAKWGQVRFDAVRQTLVWPVHDSTGAVILIELVYSDYSAHAIRRIEQLTERAIPAGTLLVARLRRTAGGLVGEPLSLINPDAGPDDQPVDALHFAPAPHTNRVSRWQSSLLKGVKADSREAVTTEPVIAPHLPLLELRQFLRMQAERGFSGHRVAVLDAEMAAHAVRLADSGYTPVAHALGMQEAMETRLIAANFLCMQYERLLGAD